MTRLFGGVDELNGRLFESIFDVKVLAFMGLWQMAKGVKLTPIFGWVSEAFGGQVF